MGTGSQKIAQRVKLHLVNYSTVLLVSLDRLLCVQVPQVNKLIVARCHIARGGRKLTVSDPIVMFFEGVLQSPINC